MHVHWRTLLPVQGHETQLTPGAPSGVPAATPYLVYRPSRGPVTAAFEIATRSYGLLPRLIARTWPAIPALTLIRAILDGTFYAHADTVLGYDAVLCLVACLAITPFVTVAGARIARLRLVYGLWMCAIGAVAVAVHLSLPRTPMGWALAGTTVNFTGLLIVALLVPMAASSGPRAQRLLGREWKRWQRALIWAVWAAVALHLAVLRGWPQLAAYTAATLPLIALRVPRLRRAIKTWRSGGYSTGGLWTVMTLCAYVFTAGLAVLLGEEAAAIASIF